jgi:small subunit ribosomal protein S6
MVLIVHPEVDGDELDGVVSNVEELITRNDGKVTKVDAWGLRKLAYPIRKQQEGRYYLIEFDLVPQGVREIERVLQLTEPVIRHLMVRLES